MFEDIIDLLGGDEFDEKPVAIEEFVTSENYLGLPPLSKYQYDSIKAMSQIYKKQTLINVYGERDGLDRWKQTCNEVILQLGKGSGKDYMSTISVAYIVYLLLCLKDPQKYYGKPPGDAIDILNIAINSEQAKNVFFKGFKMRLDKSPWFQGKYTPTAGAVTFDKGITCHSGHSERESWEGYNVLMVILDEISGFATESTSGHDQAKTASAIYDMYRASVDSRFPDFGKVVLLSFPRYKNDYIQTRYNAVVADKTVETRSYTFKLDEEIETYTSDQEKEDNEFSVEWEEDHINAYKYPKVFALRRPTWEINPTRSITDFKIQFLTNPIDALSRLPGVGPKSAQRIAFYLIQTDDDQAQELAKILLEAKERVRFCATCFNVAEHEFCNICRDPRRTKEAICVVEESKDVQAIERTREFRGFYHVLGGAISPIEGIGPDNLRIRELMSRLNDPEIKEVIIATDPNLEGEATATYLTRLLVPLGITVSRLASGLPVGGDLEYADEVTLGRAFEGRRVVS